MNSPLPARRRERGVALLIVLVVLVLIATLATEIAITARATHRMSAHSMDDLLLRTAVDGRVEILKGALRFDAGNGTGYDGEDDEWAWKNHEKLSGWGEQTSSSSGDDETQLTAAFRNSDVQLTAWVEDEHAKVNILGLCQGKGTPDFDNTREILTRLIDLYREGSSGLDLSEGEAKEMVEELEKYLDAPADTEDNPQPPVESNRGRLQSVDDLLRVPGGHWKPEILYDVKDPEATDDETSSSPSYSSSSSSSESSADPAEDSTWMRPNGVPGLARYLTVFVERGAKPDLKINVNSAPTVVLKSLLDPNDEDLADKIVTHRREGADDPTTSASGGTGSEAPTKGFFKTPDQMKSVEGMENFADAPGLARLRLFASTSSTVYSLRIIAKVAKKSSSGDESGEDASAPKEFEAIYDYRQVVQRTQAGFLTLYTERRSDPLFEK